MSSKRIFVAVVAVVLFFSTRLSAQEEASDTLERAEFERRYPWAPPSGVPPTVTLLDRFDAPSGYERVDVEAGSWPAFLRQLPIRTDRRTVHSYAGAPVAAHSAGVVALPVGDRDLQQCADAVLRLRAEFLWARGRQKRIAFHFTSGDRSAWSAWSRGERFQVDGSSVRRIQRASTDRSRSNFLDYLFHLFRYAGTRSLRFDSQPIGDDRRIRGGDFFVDPGSPGHAVLVLDVAVDDAGHRIALLGQSFMPAQEFHVVDQSGNELSGPWFRLPETSSERLQTPSWDPFRRGQARRFPTVAGGDQDP